MRSLSLAALALIASAAALFAGCGPDGETFTLRIYNPGDTALGDHSYDGFAKNTENAYALDEIRHHFCGEFDGGLLPPDFNFAPEATGDADGGDAGQVLIPPGQTYDLLLPPGCHDVRVHKITQSGQYYDFARVVGRYGETLRWRTSRVLFEDDLK